MSLIDELAKAVESAGQVVSPDMTAQASADAQAKVLQEICSHLPSSSPLRVALNEYILALYNIPAGLVTHTIIRGF